MNFKEAVEYLKIGKKVRISFWEKNIYLQMGERDGGSFIENTIMSFRQEAIPYSYDLSILTSDDWMVVGGDGENISFAEAMENIRNKKMVRLSTWPDSTFLVEDSNQLCMKRLCEHPFNPCYNDFISDQWEIIE